MSDGFFADNKKVRKVEKELLRMGVALLFMVGVMWWSSSQFGEIHNHLFLVIAAVFGAYMAVNIGANDVANNVGPAVGAGVMTLTTAIIIAAFFEAGGALIAGGEVVGTIKKKIIDPSMFVSPDEFVWAMTAALFAAALWLNIATYFKAPVSTTHSIVGGVMGGGIAAAGFSIVSWGTMGKIALSWIISPVLGGLIAALFLYIMKVTVLYKDDKLEAAKKVVPILVSIMAWAFGTYLMLKGVKKLVKVDFTVAALIGLGVAVATFAVVKPLIATAIRKLSNDRTSVNKLFAIPLIFAAALLSFSHGANDVANAVGPLAGIYDTIVSGSMSSSGKVSIPFWIMLVGALGIAVGLLLYGPRLIKTVGSEITELDAVRAYAIAMAAALTVILASQLGLPVSTTHIAVGGVFGVGFLREYLRHKRRDEMLQDEQNVIRDATDKIKALSLQLDELEAKESKAEVDYQKIISIQKEIDSENDRVKDAEKEIEDVNKANYVQRGFVTKIVSAWIITVPVAAVISALIFFVIRGMML
jgi:PiT family inorganic phosphate transporter